MAFNREKALAAAAKYAGREQHDRAAREYQAIVEADPSDIRSWVMLADCLVRAGDHAGAIDRFNKVADFYAANDEPTKAIAVYRQILSLDSGRLDIHLKIAERLHAIGRTPDAIATYEFVAQSYFQAGKVAEGLEGFRMVAELDVADVAKRLRVAELYSREGRKEEAVEHFRLAAQRLLAKNRYEDYIRVGERLLYHKDDDADILRSLAELYLVHFKEPRRALMKLNGLLRVSPNDALGLELLADTFVALGVTGKAISVASELAKDLRKGDAASKREAARIIRKALDWQPDEPEALRKALASVEEELAALGGEPEVLIDVADDYEDDLDLDVDIDEGGDDDFEIDEGEEIGDDGYDVAMTAAEKLVVETRVYVRYKMFEHALAHIQGLLDIDPNNLETIELHADVLDRMGRLGEAADRYVHLAQLVGEAEPSRAERFLDQAVALVPDHAKASMMLMTLEAVGRGTPGRRLPARSSTSEGATPTASEASSPAKVAPLEGAELAVSKVATAQETKPATASEEKPAAQKSAETKPAKPETKPASKLLIGRTPLPSLLPKREGRTPHPGRLPKGTPLPGLPPLREVTPAPARLPKRTEGDADSEAPVTTDDSGLLRFHAPKKRPPPPPPPRGRSRRRPSESRSPARGPRRDDEPSEGESERLHTPGGDRTETTAVDLGDVEELDGVEILELDDVEADEEETDVEIRDGAAQAAREEDEKEDKEEDEIGESESGEEAPSEEDETGESESGGAPSGEEEEETDESESGESESGESESGESESGEALSEEEESGEALSEEEESDEAPSEEEGAGESESGEAPSEGEETGESESSEAPSESQPILGFLPVRGPRSRRDEEGDAGVLPADRDAIVEDKTPIA
ncbi:MAG TPA: tetratricopeptide repeat protein, partial [Nannocystis exedens]|nr:tetratricopeptide repeat protein [Nannocystis exedens]